MSRRFAMTAMTAATAIGLVLPSSASPAAAQPQRPASSGSSNVCGTPIVAPCMLDATRDGIDVTQSSDWIFSVTAQDNGGDRDTQWSIDSTNNPGSYVDMGPNEAGQTWTVSVDVGTEIPRVTTTDGVTVRVNRHFHPNNGTYVVTILGQPVTQGVNADCDVSQWPWTCPSQASQDVTNFAGDVDNFQAWADQSQWNDFLGLDAWTNLEETSIPPQIEGNPSELVESLANSRFLESGQVFDGFYDINLPSRFLVDMGVDDPSTLGTDGLSASTGGGKVTVIPHRSYTEVDTTGVTFAAQAAQPAGGSATATGHTSGFRLRVRRGHVNPTPPSRLQLRRLTPQHGRLTFHPAKARGSKITGYQGSCSAHHHATRTVFGRHSPLTVKKLASGVRYRCQVRAKSKAGYGPASKPGTLPRH